MSIYDETRKKCVLKHTNQEGDTLYFYALDGLLGSCWKWKAEAQLFNSHETATCIIKELERRHKRNDVEIEDIYYDEDEE